jgi:hypothetical protein
MVEIVTNTLPGDARDKVASSVKAAIGFRPGLWQVSLLGSHKVSRFVVFIRHAEAGFNRSWVFDKVEDPVQRVIEGGLSAAGLDQNRLDYSA